MFTWRHAKRCHTGDQRIRRLKPAATQAYRQYRLHGLQLLRRVGPQVDLLGDQLQDIFYQIEKGGAKSSKQGGTFLTGVSVLPPLPKEAGDRNRTSPFAFTGNKFEFRAVGGSQSVSGPNTVLNTIVAESLDYIATSLEKAKASGKDLNKAIQEVLSAIIKFAVLPQLAQTHA